MTILDTLKFFLKHADLPFRPIHVAKHLNKPEKTVYRSLGILSRSQILCESHGLYWLNHSATTKPGIPPKKGSPILLAIILTLLTGQSYRDAELNALFQRKLTRVFDRLEQANLINRTSKKPLFKEKLQSEVWLSSSYSLTIGRSQFARAQMGAMYGK